MSSSDSTFTNETLAFFWSNADTYYALYPWIVTFLFSIDRFLYAYVYHFPLHFKRHCRSGTFGKTFQTQEYWQSFLQLGVFVKVFQFPTIAYDMFIHNGISEWKMPQDNLVMCIVGSVLFVVGQTLNLSVYETLKGKGVYYGYELGYDVPFIKGFPFNLGIPDPQYWGVILSIFGLYMAVGLMENAWFVPVVQSFWYLSSILVLESENGRKLFNTPLKNRKEGMMELAAAKKKE